MIIILSLVHKRKTRQFDFVLVLPQVDIECPVCMPVDLYKLVTSETKMFLNQVVINL